MKNADTHADNDLGGGEFSELFFFGELETAFCADFEFKYIYIYILYCFHTRINFLSFDKSS